jgi:biopolymer transport protein ExbB
VFEILKAGGLVIVLIILCSIVAMGIIIERLWTLRSRRVVPAHLVAQVWQLHKKGKLTPGHIATVRDGSPLGRILAAGLVNRFHTREVMKEAIEETGRQVVHELERYLNTLGTIASISPLLGLLGTVLGMIKVFASFSAQGVGDAALLAHGVAEALVNTAAGLAVAIPALAFSRYFNGQVERLVVAMEEEALKMVEVMHGEREQEKAER